MVITLNQLVSLVLLGIFNGVMQGLMFYNPFAWVDKKYTIKWFANGASPINRTTWQIRLFGKYRKVFHIFPLIMFTDLFHMCHGLFGFCIGEVIANANGMQDLDRLLCWIIVALTYSSMFEFQLSLMKKIGKRNGLQ